MCVCVCVGPEGGTQCNHRRRLLGSSQVCVQILGEQHTVITGDCYSVPVRCVNYMLVEIKNICDKIK